MNRVEEGPRVTKLVFVDGALHRSKYKKLMDMRLKLQNECYNVYQLFDSSGKVFEAEMDKKLVALDRIIQHYASCLGGDNWNHLFAMLRETINYEYERCQREMDYMVEECKRIEYHRCRARDLSCYEWCPSEVDFFGLFHLRNPVVILMEEGLLNGCSLMLGLCNLCPVKSGMSLAQEAMWKDTMETARKYAVELLECMFTALRLCTDELEVCGTMFGLVGSTKTLNEFILDYVTEMNETNVHCLEFVRPVKASLLDMMRVHYATWWTGARVLFGKYLPYSDGEVDLGRRRIDGGVSGEGLWDNVLMKQKEFGMSVTTRLKWYKESNTLMDLFTLL
jgi:hypothetical protein